jgi:hypothetical protein
MSFLPREHGAYGQMALPIVTSFAVAGISAPALLLALGVASAFLAHEPLLIVLGRRGARLARDQRRPAAAWLVFTTALGLTLALAARWLTRPELHWSFYVPLLPAALVVAAILRKCEKTWQGEVAAALAFSVVAVPTTLIAGASVETAVGVSTAFTVTFVASTLAVRAIVLDVRSGGNARAASATRMGVLALALGGGAVLLAAASHGALPGWSATACVPGLATAVYLSLWPPHPVRLRAVGWMLLAASIAVAVLLVARPNPGG